MLETGQTARFASADWLARALRASRADTCARFADWRRALPDLRVPMRDTLNPPLWELGHIGWFQAYWIGRFSERDRGVDADPDACRSPDVRPDAEALYHSSHVPHAQRWLLPLPSPEHTLDDLERQLAQTLALLAGLEDGMSPVASPETTPRQPDALAEDRALYFFRLALFHEDMHHEAALYMAHHLQVSISDMRWQRPPPLTSPRIDRFHAAGSWTLGWPHEHGFCFDNEAGAHSVALPDCHIDSRVITWGEYLPFVEAGGYRTPAFWTPAGLAWLRSGPAGGHTHPVALQERQGRWWMHHGPDWSPVDPDAPACFLNAHEAEAWCAWAGRRLPTEAEWERAACSAGDPADSAGHPGFAWGQVWEWTASRFDPYPGFVAHPYRDYSQPWFGQRRVLRGGSYMTQPRMKHPRYRNYFIPDRTDIAAGFRSCA